MPIRKGPIFANPEGYKLKEGNLRKATFKKPEGSQSEVSRFFFKFGGVPIRRGLVFTKPEGSQSGGVLYLLTQRGPNPEGSKFCQSGGVSILSIRKGPIFANPEGYRLKEGNLRKATFKKPEGSQSEGSRFFFKFGGVPIRSGLVFTKPEGSQSGGVLYLLTQRGPNPEGSKFCQSGGVSILPNRKGPIFANPEGYYFIERLR